MQALLLIDLQIDFIKENFLTPPVNVLLGRVSALVAACRSAEIPVLHVRTIVSPDGSDRMPHWQRNNNNRCVEDTPGAQPPEGFEALPGEKVFKKIFYSAFSNPEIDKYLRHEGINTVLVAGVHTHSCVQATVLDAYQRGYNVKLVTDAVASYSPLHAALTLRHLQERACESVSISELMAAFSSGFSQDDANKNNEIKPVAFINGTWLSAPGHKFWEMRDPCQWESLLALIPLAQKKEVQEAVALAGSAQKSWVSLRESERLNILQAWLSNLRSREAHLLDLIICEVAKPRRDAQAEIDYGFELLRASIERMNNGTLESPAGDATVHYRPRGVIAVITSWNNPFALPVGKLAPALAYGNTAVWKPALQSPEVARLLVDSLVEAGLPVDCLSVIFGDADTARYLLESEGIDAVTFTGSENAGQEISATCGLRQIPLQAELGGNNAALVAADTDIKRAAFELAEAVFSFSGQRCTAPRRLIVIGEVFEEFSNALIAAIRELKIGQPTDADTHLGPLISRERQELMMQWIKAALNEGGHILTGGNVPAEYSHGCWFEPTVLTGLSPDSFLIQEETFGPLAILLRARNFDHGIELCNKVRQGLRAVCYSGSEDERKRFVKYVQAGVIHLNEAAIRIDVEAPFFGWKASGIGVPEHGRWDQDFFTRVQAVYRK